MSLDKVGQGMKVDWTIDPDSGHSNSSAEFLKLAEEVGRLIRNSANDIVQGQTSAVGRLIMARLAHIHGLAPAAVNIQAASANGSDNLHGHFEWNGQPYRFDAVPLEAPTPNQEGNLT